eukprot:TRINITY_DN74623_c0_g1_i1.p1 TRINITY_DN74623_c0_g1~~TRINITY_DN74623_c0_g1_i1.p1  ORF type:complete len:934 (-),score=113.15 TRINITY_DN74623_c0_g1_i1:63-2864(-)
MGQVAGAWCGEGLLINSFDAPGILGQRGVAQSRGSEAEAREADRLLEGCSRHIAEVLRATGQWKALRCRPWLSQSAFNSLQRSLQRCQLLKLDERHQEARCEEDGAFAKPHTISWADMDLDHVIAAGQVFKKEDAPVEKIKQLRRLGLQVIRQGKVGVVLMVGGANLRLGFEEPPAACNRKLLGLVSGKSILQLLCERIRRVVHLSKALEENAKGAATRPTVPVFVMTSRLTHRCVVEHFENNKYFGLKPRDVMFFEQTVFPVLSIEGHLLPQSLAGEFAHAPAGTGQLLTALASSSALEQMRDRGVESLHIVGTENLLCRVCDPVFIGFCRDLEVDCATKIVDRIDPDEDIELFCVKQSQVSTPFADIEEAACGVEPAVAPAEVLNARGMTGALSYAGNINSFFMTVDYIENVVGRPVRPKRLPRKVPHLDFHIEPEVESNLIGAEDGVHTTVTHDDGPAVGPGNLPLVSSQPLLPLQTRSSGSLSRAAPMAGPMGAGSAPAAAVIQDAHGNLTGNAAGPGGGPDAGAGAADSGANPSNAARSKRAICSAPYSVLPGSWPPESGSPELVCQRTMLMAAAEVRGNSRAALDENDDGWRCDVRLDGSVPLVVVRVRGAAKGPMLLPTSLHSPGVSLSALEGPTTPLRCSLVVPNRVNAYVLEVSILDYFAYTDRAVAFHVDRATEYAPIRERSGKYTAEVARSALYNLHVSWLKASGTVVMDPAPRHMRGDVHSADPPVDLCVEVSPLLSYEGESLKGVCKANTALCPPCHLAGTEETKQEEAPTDAVEENAQDGLDTKSFYLQEYPQRLTLSTTAQCRAGGAGVRMGPGRTMDAVSQPPVGTSAQQEAAHAGQQPKVSLDEAKELAAHPGLSAPGVSELRVKSAKAPPTSAPPYQAGAIELPPGFNPSGIARHVAASNTNSGAMTAFWEKGQA